MSSVVHQSCASLLCCSAEFFLSKIHGGYAEVAAPEDLTETCLVSIQSELGEFRQVYGLLFMGII